MNKLSPFKWFVLQNFPFIEADFDALTNYELMCKIVEKLNEVVADVNLVTDKVNELGASIQALYNWFENLDVQDEIDNKLDEMAQDGTLGDIINQEIFGELNTRLGQAENDIDAVELRLGTDETRVSSLENYNLPINQYKRENEYNEYKSLVFPIFKTFLNFVRVLTNGKKWIGKIDEKKMDSFKNTSTNTWYIAPDGVDTNAGTSPSAPKKNLGSLINSTITEGDTIVLLPGIYERSTVNATINKSCNIIAEKPDTVYLTNSWKLQASNLSFVQNETYTKVYEVESTNYGNVTGIIDLQDYKTPIAMKLVTSLNECNNTENSYFISGNKISVHMLNDTTPSKSNIALNYPWGYPSIKVTENLASGIKVYMENINVIGGSDAGFKINKSLDTRHQVTCVNCKFMFTETDAGFKNIGSNTKLINCVAKFNKNDGFSYHESAIGFELDCVGCYNGHTGAYSNNGSTAHSTNITRIGGKYYNNVGPNIADVFDETNSLNIGCLSFDSAYQGETPVNGADFEIQEGNMYLIGCQSRGSSSIVNLENYDNGNLYVDSSTEYDESDGTLTSYTAIYKDSSPYQ